MKKLWYYLRDLWRADFHKGVYLGTAVFLAVAFTVNYHFDFDRSVMKAHYGATEGLLWTFSVYCLAWYFPLGLAAWLKADYAALRHFEFWLKSLSFLFLIAFVSNLAWHRPIAQAYSPQFSYYFMVKVLVEFKRIVFYTLPLLAIWYYYDRKSSRMYGFTLQQVSLKPYFQMLLVAWPFMIAASFTKGFLNAYPRFKPWMVGEGYLLSDWQMVGIFELAYAMDFVFVEWIFRGALVLGFLGLLGKGAVLPMASLYAFFHFGKPFGEAFSSIFGGYLLGAIAYYTRSIVGGICIHVGIAWSMELFAWVQHLFRGTAGPPS